MEIIVRCGLLLFIVGTPIFAEQQRMAGNVPLTRFSCQGRPTGYYADVDTGCQIYHMCDELGRKFSFACPNTTLFQQRMMVCDHWYMVNCSKAESDYSANLLIGQRDKPFVSADAQASRTPRPDILTVPYTSSYYDGLREAESKFPYHPDNSISESELLKQGQQKVSQPSKKLSQPNHYNTIDDTRGNKNKYDTSTGKYKNPQGSYNQQNFNYNNKYTGNNYNSEPTEQYRDYQNPNYDQNYDGVLPLNHDQYNKGKQSFGGSTSRTPSADDLEVDVRMDTERRQNNQFINRFNPNGGNQNKQTTQQYNNRFSSGTNTNQNNDQFIDRFDPTSTAMTKKDIISINNQLQPNAFEDGENRRTSNGAFVNGDRKDVLTDRFGNEEPEFMHNGVKSPSRTLEAPKHEQPILPSTTMGPPIYYEWKWAAPAFDLEPPRKDSQLVNRNAIPDELDKNVKIPVFTTPSTTTFSSKSTTNGEEYKLSSYFVPDYIFPLDREHPSYDGKRTSFLASPEGYGENPACPHCHPAYLRPGECEPCIMRKDKKQKN